MKVRIPQLVKVALGLVAALSVRSGLKESQYQR